MSKPTVIIIGGGLAGISAAVQLSSKEFQVTLIDQRSTLGGRAYSYHKPGAPELDNGHHISLNCYQHLKHLLSTIHPDRSIKSLIDFQPLLEMHFRGQYAEKPVHTTLKAKRLPAPMHLLSILWGLPMMTLQKKLQSFKLGRAMAQRHRLSSEDCSVLEWLQQHQQPAIAIDWLWEPLCTAALNRRPKAASAKLFAEVIDQAFFSSPGDSSLGIFRLPLSKMFGAQAQDWFTTHQTNLLLGKTVKKMVLKSGKISHLILEDGTSISADHYISAVPHYRFVEWCDEELLAVWPHSRKFSELSVSPIVNAYLLYQGNPLDLSFACLLGSRFQWVFSGDHLLETEQLAQGRL
jgi:predicted NAD/FAD-binding protein